MKTISKILLPIIFAIGLGGCYNYDIYTKCKEKDNLVLRSSRDGRGNLIDIQEKNSEGKTIAHLVALDNVPYSKDSVGDGRIDKITFFYAPEGSVLEKYSIEKINQLYQEVKETGCDCE